MMTSYMLPLFTFISLSQTTHSQAIVCNQGDTECNTNINCVNSNCQVTCNEYGCNFATINCLSDHCDVTCDGIWGCSGTTIKCPVAAGCTVQCIGANSCRNIKIIGGSGTESRLVIGCKGTTSCKNATFDGRYTKELTITDCTQTNSCIGMTVYCPQYEHSSNPRCSISGNSDGMGGTSTDPMTFYAVNGWDDVNMIGTTDQRVGIMHCKNSYDTSCIISETFSTLNAPWRCQGGTDCDDLTPNPTPKPIEPPTTAQPTTAQPTTAQPTTAQPTTDQPTTDQPTTVQPTTKNPTNTPTTSDPSKTPTMYPTTSDPSIAPTTIAPSTANPTTNQPSLTPTTATPTDIPTERPTMPETTTTTTTTTIACTDKDSTVITTSFGFTEQNVNHLSREEMDNIITNITNKFIKSKLQEKVDCAVLDIYDNHINIIQDVTNEAMVNISVCFDCNGEENNLIISEDEMIDLEGDFVELFQKETQILIIMEDSTDISVDVIYVDAEQQDTSTTPIYIGNDIKTQENDNMNVVIGLLVGLILCVCIICIFVILVKKRNNKAQKIGVVMINQQRNQHIIHTQSIKTDQIGEILGEDDEEELDDTGTGTGTNSDGNMGDTVHTGTAGGDVDYDTGINNDADEFVIDDDEENGGVTAGNDNNNNGCSLIGVQTLSCNFEGGLNSIDIGDDEIIIGDDEINNNDRMTPQCDDIIICDEDGTTDEGDNDTPNDNDTTDSNYDTQGN